MYAVKTSPDSDTGLLIVTNTVHSVAKDWTGLYSGPLTRRLIRRKPRRSAHTTWNASGVVAWILTIVFQGRLGYSALCSVEVNSKPSFVGCVAAVLSATRPLRRCMNLCRLR